MEGQQHQQQLIDLPKVVAGAVATPLAALLTSRFGVAGTMVGLAVSAVVVTTISDVLKVYLARVPGTVKKIPGGFSKKPLWQRILYSFRLPFSKFSSLDPARRRSILTRSLVAGVIVFLIGLIVVTGVEASVGQNLSCWVWKNCPAQSTSTGDGGASQTTSTLPSILGGGQGTISSTSLQSTPSTPQQQQRGSSPPGTPQAPSQTPPVTPGTGTPSSAGVERPTPSPSAQPGQQQGPSSGVSQDQQQTPSNSSAPADQQPTSSDQQPSSSDQQPTSSDQQPSSSDQQPSSSDQQQPSADQQQNPDNSGQVQQEGAGGSTPSQIESVTTTQYESQ
jgi:hypothetical protein